MSRILALRISTICLYWLSIRQCQCETSGKGSDCLPWASGWNETPMKNGAHIFQGFTMLSMGSFNKRVGCFACFGLRIISCLDTTDNLLLL